MDTRREIPTRGDTPDNERKSKMGEVIKLKSEVRDDGSRWDRYCDDR